MVTSLVAGAGGFIGGHLVNDLLSKGHNVVAVDIKPFSSWYQLDDRATSKVLDLRNDDACIEAVVGVDRVYNLAADMGGMGFIENNKAACMLSVLINTNLLEASKSAGVEKFFFASSACVYNGTRQTRPDVTALAESDAYPADPEDGYGWEKLFSERMCRHFYEDYGLKTYVARFHNVYGPMGTFTGGREKAPAALCRKVIEVSSGLSDSVEIWGDGEQTRSFTYIDDCIKGINAIVDSDLHEPVNLGSSGLMSINQMVSTIESVAGIKVDRNYDLSAPQGVRGRNSDNTLFRETFGWEPSIEFKDGIAITYQWIQEQMDSNNIEKFSV